MKKINFKLQKIYFLLWFFLIIGLNYKTFIPEKIESNKSNSTIAIVEESTITESIETTWSAWLANEQSLSFNQTWKITKVNFQAWDVVKTWDIIAEIDNSDGLNSVENAKINLENAKINLKQLYEDTSENQILQAENSLENSKKELEIGNEELENLYNTKKIWLDKINTSIENLEVELKNLENSLKTSQKEYETTQKEQENSLNSIEDNLSNTEIQTISILEKNLIDIKQDLDDIDNVLWISEKNKWKNDDFESYLSVKNSQYKNEATWYYYNTFSGILNIEEKMEEVKNYNTEEIINLINDYIEVYNNLSKTAEALYNAWDNSIESVEFTQNDIENIKNDANSIITSSISNISSLNNTIVELNNLTDIDLQKETFSNSLNSKEQSISQVELSIKKKEEEIKNEKENYSTQESSYNLQLKSKINSIENLEKTIEINKNNLEELLEWPTAENIQKANNSIKLAQMNLENAYDDLEKYQLIAPFDWVIRKIDYQVWDNILSDSQKYVYIENPNLLEISVSLDQIDIIKVNESNKAFVTFDAYPNKKIQAKVKNIDTTPIITSWVVTYEVIIVLDDKNFDWQILSWMTADIEIITKEINNALLINSEAIKQKWEEYYVTLLNKWEEVETKVEIWNIQDWKTQIISWLKSWEKVIIKSNIDTNNQKNTQKNSSNLLGLPQWNTWKWNRGSMWWGKPPF